MSNRALMFFSTNTEEATVILAQIDNLVDSIMQVESGTCDALNAKLNALEMAFYQENTAPPLSLAKLPVYREIADILIKFVDTERDK